MAAPDTRTDADTTALKKYFITFLSSQMMMEGQQLPLFEFWLIFRPGLTAVGRGSSEYYNEA
jgi:hypothetical protein